MRSDALLSTGLAVVGLTLAPGARLATAQVRLPDANATTPPAERPVDVNPTAARGAAALDAVALRAASLGVASLNAAEPHPASPDQARWTLAMAPYLWAAGIEGAVAVRGQTAQVDIGFSDLIKKINGAFMLVLEARKGPWGILSELFLIRFSEQAGTPGPLFGGVELRADRTLIELSTLYRILEPRPVALDLVMGGRVWDLATRLDFSEGELPALLIEAGERWVDPLIGLRAIAGLGDRWMLQGRGEIGGFSVGSDLTWQLVGLAGYQIGAGTTLGAGYRHLDVDFENEDVGFLFDVGLGGWIAGVTIDL